MNKAIRKITSFYSNGNLPFGILPGEKKLSVLVKQKITTLCYKGVSIDTYYSSRISSLCSPSSASLHQTSLLQQMPNTLSLNNTNKISLLVSLKLCSSQKQNTLVQIRTKILSVRENETKYPFHANLYY